MRSDLVYSAGLQVHNRFLLASAVMRAVRKLHIDSTRTEDTINKVFVEMAKSPELIAWEHWKKQPCSKISPR